MKFLTLLALIATLTLTSCGGSDDGGSGGGGVPAPSPAPAGDSGGGGTANPGGKVVVKPKPDPNVVNLTSLTAAEANKKIIADMMLQLPSGQSIKAKGRTATQCGGIDYSYTVTPVNDFMKISLRTYFAFQDGMDLTAKREMLTKTNKCRKPVQDFYGRYNIIFDWSYASEFGGKFTQPEADVTVVLDSNDGRASSRHWYANSYSHECRVIIHEIGHLLGLPDEYSESGTCRSSTFASEGPSMMKDHTDPSADFLPRHILAMLEQAMISEIAVEATTLDVDLENEARNLKDELNSYGCDLVSPQNLASYLKVNGSVKYWESDLSSYIATNIKMSDNQTNSFFGHWTYYEGSKWNRPTEIRCDVNERVFGVAMFIGEQFPLIHEALGSSAIKIKYSSNDLTALHKVFPPLLYSEIGALKNEKVEESDAVERNYY
jgi:hypothetical protein